MVSLFVLYVSKHLETSYLREILKYISSVINFFNVRFHTGCSAIDIFKKFHGEMRSTVNIL